MNLWHCPGRSPGSATQRAPGSARTMPRLRGKAGIRVAVTNHRTTYADIELLADRLAELAKP